jgi:hypothetical protein
MKKSFINKESILVFIFFGFSIIFPLFSYGNYWYYIARVTLLIFLSIIIIFSFSFAKSKSIWGFLRVFGISLSAIFLFVTIDKMYLILTSKTSSSGLFSDERLLKYLFGFLISLLVLGVGEIIIYLRDIRFLLSLNKNNKDYFECDDCYGKGFIEKEEDDELEQKNCENCSGLGFLEKNSNNWFPRK